MARHIASPVMVSQFYPKKRNRPNRRYTAVLKYLDHPARSGEGEHLGSMLSWPAHRVGLAAG
jgi:hypothetical protein